MGDSGWKELLAGGFGGLCVVVTGHPFDTVKVLIQSSTKYSGTLHAIKETFRVDGFKGYYRGMSTIVVGIAPIFALQFWSYEKSKYYLKSNKLIREHNLKEEDIIYRKFDYVSGISGGIAGFCTTIIVGPGERIKCLLQTHNSEKIKKFKGPIDVVKKLYTSQGLVGIFRGTFLTLLRDVPGTFVYFGVYETMKQLLYTEEELLNKNISIFKIMLSGAMAGLCCWLSVMPQDVVKSTVQSKYQKISIKKVVKHLYVNHGISAFFRGALPITSRAIVVNAACFLGYEIALQLFKSLESYLK
ncbi:hypothetical protein SNEBB_004746 [Seison nebaliae]|nr:hypothetical protein SNEBB_004746 [Seison nebaliae]